MENIAAQLKRGISRQFSTGSLKRTLSRQFTRQSPLDPKRNNLRFSFGRQSSLGPIRRSPSHDDDDEVDLSVPTMNLLFFACRGDVHGVEDLLNQGIDVNNIDLDGCTALHISACEGHVEVVRLPARVEIQRVAGFGEGRDTKGGWTESGEAEMKERDKER